MNWVCYLETGESQEQAGAHSDLIDEVPVTGLNALPHIAHDMHTQDLYCSQLDISWQLMEVRQVLYRLLLLARHPLHMHTQFSHGMVWCVSPDIPPVMSSNSDLVTAQ